MEGFGFRMQFDDLTPRLYVAGALQLGHLLDVPAPLPIVVEDDPECRGENDNHTDADPDGEDHAVTEKADAKWLASRPSASSAGVAVDAVLQHIKRLI
jgi:hypothetical protein